MMQVIIQYMTFWSFKAYLIIIKKLFLLLLLIRVVCIWIGKIPWNRWILLDFEDFVSKQVIVILKIIDLRINQNNLFYYGTLKDALIDALIDFKDENLVNVMILSTSSLGHMEKYQKIIDLNSDVVMSSLCERHMGTPSKILIKMLKDYPQALKHPNMSNMASLVLESME